MADIHEYQTASEKAIDAMNAEVIDTSVADFHSDLKALLKKHNVTIRAEHFKNDMLMYATFHDSGFDTFLQEEHDTKYIILGEEAL